MKKKPAKRNGLKRSEEYDGPRFPCTECGRNSLIRYGQGWGGVVKEGESLCAKCFEARGGRREF